VAGKRKFLKTIYAIQRAFGSEFGHISRNFSFGIKPTKEEQEKLERWFIQVSEAKQELYNEIYKDFTLHPYSFLDATFDYASFFKGNSVFARIKKTEIS
jgi:hypothetical protein